MKPYTVLLLYPDYMNDNGDETYLAHVEATDPREAVTAARQQAVAANTDEHGCNLNDPTDMTALIVFPGHHTPALTAYDDLSTSTPNQSNTMEHEYVLATLTPYPSIYGYYPSQEAAAVRAEAANAHAKHIAETQGTPLEHYAPMLLSDYQQTERQFYLNQPLREVTEEKYHEMLEVIPPRYHGMHGGIQSFILGEHWKRPYAEQYASCDGRFFTRMVDTGDESTWITRDEITSHLAGQPQTAWQRRIEEGKRNIEPSR
jgi:hypothetical protein